MKRVLYAGALALAFSLGACSTATDALTGVGDFIAGSAQAATPETSADEQTYADLTLSVDLATQWLDLAVTSHKWDAGTLRQMATYNDAVHSAWVILRDAHAAHQSLKFAALRSALATFNTFRAQHATL